MMDDMDILNQRNNIAGDLIALEDASNLLTQAYFTASGREGNLAKAKGKLLAVAEHVQGIAMRIG